MSKEERARFLEWYDTTDQIPEERETLCYIYIILYIYKTIYYRLRLLYIIATMVRGQAYCLRPAWSFNLTPPICLQDVALWHDPFFHHWVSDIWQVYVVTAHVGLHMIRCILILII